MNMNVHVLKATSHAGRSVERSKCSFARVKFISTSHTHTHTQTSQWTLQARTKKQPPEPAKLPELARKRQRTSKQKASSSLISEVPLCTFPIGLLFRRTLTNTKSRYKAQPSKAQAAYFIRVKITLLWGRKQHGPLVCYLSVFVYM